MTRDEMIDAIRRGEPVTVQVNGMKATIEGEPGRDNESREETENRIRSLMDFLEGVSQRRAESSGA